MTRNSLAATLVLLLAITGYVRVSHASIITNGPNGINSTGLGLTGAGVAIGQVEIERPGLPSSPGNTRDAAIYTNDAVQPTKAFKKDKDVELAPTDFDDDVDKNDHAEQVAGIMISTDSNVPGVAPGSSLYSSAVVTGGNFAFDYDGAILSMQKIASQTNMRAVNHSWGKKFKTTMGILDILDGNNDLTQAIDWSAKKHNVLHAIAGNQTGSFMAPKDNFNGITVGKSVIGSSGKYDTVDTDNLLLNLVGNRVSLDILAPGIDVQSTYRNNKFNPPAGSPPGIDDGTSFAAPHVTGTIALLQEYGNTQVMAHAANPANAPNWGGLFNSKPTAQRHEVMKAVLMNSADKIKDTSSNGKYLGMDRTVLKKLKAGQSAGQEDDWFDSDAAFDFEIPLDEEMGAGHLNAMRAVQQFAAGEHESNGTNGFPPPVGEVPVIGWDYGTTDGNNFRVNKYVLDTPLVAGNFISITLAWDREVEFQIDSNMDGNFDAGDFFEDYTDLDDELTNMDLWLVPKGTDDGFGDHLAISESIDSSVEHIFAEIDITREYEIWVFHNQQFDAPQNYALAWWYGLAPELTPPNPTADFDADGDVDAADLAQWQGDFGINGDSDADNDGDTDGADFLAWQRNFGATSLSASTAVPEPSCLLLLVLGLPIFLSRRGIRPDSDLA